MLLLYPAFHCPADACSAPPPGQNGWSIRRFGSTAKVLAECNLKYYRISDCGAMPAAWAMTGHSACSLTSCGVSRRMRRQMASTICGGWRGRRPCGWSLPCNAWLPFCPPPPALSAAAGEPLSQQHPLTSCFHDGPCDRRSRTGCQPYHPHTYANATPAPKCHESPFSHLSAPKIRCCHRAALLWCL